MKRYKRAWVLVLMSILVINMFNIALASQDISLYINGEKAESQYNPQIINNRSIAPVSLLKDKLGLGVTWNDKARTVTIQEKNNKTVLTIDSNIAVKNGQTYTLTTAPQIIKNRTYIPLKIIKELLGYELKWNGDLRRVDIYSAKATISEFFLARVDEEKHALLLNISGDYNYTNSYDAESKKHIIDFESTSTTLVEKVDGDNKLIRNAEIIQVNPTQTRVIINCTDKESQIKFKKVSGGYLGIYIEPKEVTEVPMIPINPAEPVKQEPKEVEKPVLNINVANLKDYKLQSLFMEPRAPVYGVISSPRVNLRTEPSTADPKTVRVTVDGGTKLEVIGQSFGWYNILYKNEELWVADWLLTLDLEMKRNNVNVRTGPGTNFAVIDMVQRGEWFKVLERKPEWVKVETKNGKQGYIAEWLVAINDRLIEVEHNSQDVAKELTFTLKNTKINQVSFNNKPSIISSVSKKTVGNDVEVKVIMSEPIAYEVVKDQYGLKVLYGAVLTDLKITESEGRVTLDVSFDKPTNFTVFQNLLNKELTLDFANSIAITEQTKELNNKIASVVKLVNKSESASLQVALNNLGTYKVNTSGFSKNLQLVLLSSSLSGKVIAIDAGHGGQRPGAYRGGTYEKEITLPVALKVQKLLTDKGITVIMTRVTDKTVLLDERVDYVNGYNADLAVSIHVNDTKYGAGIASGVETWYYPKPENERLAQYLQTGLLAATEFRNRGIKPSTRLRVTKNWKMPSALMEIGFLDNVSERNQLKTDQLQQKIAENIVMSIERFFIEK